MKAIIFDFDGTIVDTEQLEYTAWQQLYREYKIELPLIEWQKRIGAVSENFDPINYLHQQLKYKIHDIEERYTKIFTLLETKLTPLPGILDWLTVAKELGLRLAIASNSNRQWIDKYLSMLKLTHHFEVIVTCDNVKKLKPDPEIYLLALQRLNLQAHDAIAIEDSPPGARAAIAANLKCILVPNRLIAHLTYPDVFKRVTQLSEITIANIMKTIYQF